MLGLKRGSVALFRHNPDWLELGRKAQLQVREACGEIPVHVEHVGSTSVPGLRAKPILDLVIGLAAPEQIELVRDALSSAGFIYRGEGTGSIGYLFVWETEPNFRTVHVHALPHGSSHWCDYVVFRDLLRSNPDTLKRYEELKLRSAQRFPDDRKHYSASKEAFVRGVLKFTKDL